jgi:hypothetical protein
MLLTFFGKSQTLQVDSSKNFVPQISEQAQKRMLEAEEEQRNADSIAIASYTKKFVDSIPLVDLKLIAVPNMKVIYTN